MARLRRVCWVGVFGFFVAWTDRAHTSDEPSSSGGVEMRRAPRSALENSLIAEALAHLGWQEDPNPTGKRIESIEVYVARAFDDRDPIPNFVNIFHVRTRDWILSQEVLQEVGQIYDRGKVLETERNLRTFPQLSVANVVVAQGSDERSARLLVVAKDVWSLRLDSAWDVGSSGLDYLFLNPSEWNLAGTRMTLGALFLLERDRYLIGGNYSYPRVGGSRLDLTLSAGVYTNRFSGRYEGNYGSFVYELPQYSRYQRWSYGVETEWSFALRRQYEGSSIDEFIYDGAQGTEVLPLVFHEETVEARYWARRSWGIDKKTDLEFGFEIDRGYYYVPDDEAYSREALEAFRSVELPVSDTRLSPYLTLAAYESEFHRVLSLETYGLQEDYRLGPGVSTTVFAAARALGSSRDLVGTIVRAGYTWAVGDGLIRVGASNRVVVAHADEHEGYASLRARWASPHWGPGRVHVDGYLGYRYHDYLNVVDFRLGGDNRLRGYAPGQFRGTDLVSINTEWRSDSVDVLSAQVGMVAFFDVGAIDDDFSELAFHQGVGLGLRMLFPQLERVVSRFDWGVPVSPGWKVFPGSFIFTVGQAFPMPLAGGGGGDPYEEP